jgi:hypothetical protein
MSPSAQIRRTVEVRMKHERAIATNQKPILYFSKHQAMPKGELLSKVSGLLEGDPFENSGLLGRGPYFVSKLSMGLNT